MAQACLRSLPSSSRSDHRVCLPAAVAQSRRYKWRRPRACLRSTEPPLRRRGPSRPLSITRNAHQHCRHSRLLIQMHAGSGCRVIGAVMPGSAAAAASGAPVGAGMGPPGGAPRKLRPPIRHRSGRDGVKRHANQEPEGGGAGEEGPMGCLRASAGGNWPDPSCPTVLGPRWAARPHSALLHKPQRARREPCRPP